MSNTEKAFILISVIIAIFSLVQTVLHNSAIYAALFTLDLYLLLNLRLDTLSKLIDLNIKRVDCLNKMFSREDEEGN